MSLSIPLTVRLSTSRGDRHITREVRDLRFGWVDPGGYRSCQVALDRPLTIQPDEIAYYGYIIVYDARTGLVVWEGRLEDPGRSAGSDGQVWELTGIGGQAHLSDRTVPLVYIDSEPTYERVDNVTPGGQDSMGASPGDASGADRNLLLQFPEGLSVTTNSRVVVRYNKIQRAGQKLARLSATWDAGVIDTNHSVQAVARTDGSLASGENAATATLSTAGGTLSAVITTNFTSGRNTIEWRQIRTAGGASTIPSDNYWVSVTDEIIQATRYNVIGFEMTAAADYLTNYLLAHEIVTDIIGRLLVSLYEPTIATTATHQITQFAYPDGVDGTKMLADLLALESGFTWRVWERTTAGKYKFEWTTTPSTIRYEADVLDGYDAPGSADGLYNRVTVRWRDSGGHVRTTERTSTSPALTAAGLTRQGMVDLGDEVGTQAAAERAGDQWLADRTYPPNAGSLRIARPILDLSTGRMVQPWEIRPGLIRVRGVLPRVDALNTSTRDGVTLFRIVAAEYRASDAAAMLELDSYAPSTVRAITDLLRRPVHRRR